MNAELHNVSHQVLIADASRSNRVMLRKHLERQGYPCVTVETGSQVISTLRELPIQILLLDMRFPDMEGEQVIRQINRQLASKRPVIIAVTACTMAGDKQRILDCGCDAYVPKPVDVKHLISLMDDMMVSGDHRRLIA